MMGVIVVSTSKTGARVGEAPAFKIPEPRGHSTAVLGDPDSSGPADALTGFAGCFPIQGKGLLRGEPPPLDPVVE